MNSPYISIFTRACYGLALIVSLLASYTSHAATFNYRDYFEGGNINDVWVYSDANGNEFSWSLYPISNGPHAGRMHFGNAAGGIVYDVSNDMVQWHQLIPDPVMNPPFVYETSYDTDTEYFVDNTTSLYFTILSTYIVQAGTYNNVLAVIWLDKTLPANIVNSDLGVDNALNYAVTDVEIYDINVGLIHYYGVDAATGTSDGNEAELVSHYTPTSELFSFADYFIGGGIGDTWIYEDGNGVSQTWTQQIITSGAYNGLTLFGNNTSGYIYEVSAGSVLWYALDSQDINPPFIYENQYVTDIAYYLDDQTSLYFKIIPSLGVSAGTYNNVLMVAWLDNTIAANTLNTNLGISSSINFAVTDVEYYDANIGLIAYDAVDAATGTIQNNSIQLTSYTVNSGGGNTGGGSSGGGALFIPELALLMLLLSLKLRRFWSREP